MPTFSLLTTSLIQTEDISENDWHLQRKFYLADRYNDFSCHFLPPTDAAERAQRASLACAMPSREEEKPPLRWIKKVAQKPRGDNFRGHTQKFPKTDAVALLLREKVSVF